MSSLFGSSASSAPQKTPQRNPSIMGQRKIITPIEQETVPTKKKTLLGK